MPPDLQLSFNVKGAEHQAEATFAKVFDLAPLYLTVTSLETGKFVAVNDAFVSLSGYTREEAIGKSSRDLGLWADPAAYDRSREQLEEAGMAGEQEVRLRLKSGEERTFMLSAKVMELGGERCILNAGVDITWRTQAEQRVRESETHYRTLFNSTDEAFCVVEVIFQEAKAIDYRFLEANAQFEQQTGLVQAVGKRMLELAPDHEAYWFEIYGRVALTGEPVRFTHEAKALNRWFDVYAFRAGGAESRHVGILFKDVTTRKRAEKALAESEARYRIVAETASDVLVTIDENNTILYLNPAAEKIFGHPLQQMLGQSLTMLMPEYLRHVHEAAIKRYTETGRKHISWDAVEVPGLHRDGHEIDLEVSFGEHRQEGRHLFTAIIRDITERKKASEALAELNRELEDKVRARTRQVQDLAGQLTLAEAKERARLAQVLHDELQQQLYAAQFSLRGLSLQLRDDVAKLTTLAELKGLIDGAIAISRTTTANLSPPVLHHEGLAEALTWLGSDMAARYDLSVRVETPSTFSVPDEAVRVLLFNLVRELLFNVVKHAEVNEATVTLMEDAELLTLTVSDLGNGFDPDVLEQTATGFGLYGVRKRLELFDGRLDLVSVPGEGTHVTIHLPTKPFTLD